MKRIIFPFTALAAFYAAYAAPPISAVAVRQCGKVQSVFVTVDDKHAVRFGGDDRAEYTVKDDGQVGITTGAAMPLGSVFNIAKQAVMQVTVLVPCEHAPEGEQATALHKVSDTAAPKNSVNAASSVRSQPCLPGATPSG